MKLKEKKILISTGGTGGHVFPAYSLAKNFLDNQIEVEITTDERGLKYLKKYKNLKLKIINSGTIFHKNPILIFLNLFKIINAFFKSIFLLKKLMPDVVIGMGGYSSFPICMGAKILNIPFLIYENNLFVGKTNRILIPFAEKMLISFPEIEGLKESHKKKVISVGNLVRQEILNFKKTQLQKSNKLNLLILGGSQAAKSFGELLPEIFEKCSSEKIELEIIQQCLDSQKHEIEKIYEKSKINFQLFNFSNNLEKFFEKTDLVITRSGASMSAELINCNMPFIAVPFPYAADNHQLKNAMYFKKKGYCFLIEEKELPNKLFPLIKSIHEDRNLLEKIRVKQKNFSDTRVFENIKDELKKLFDEKN